MFVQRSAAAAAAARRTRTGRRSVPWRRPTSAPVTTTGSTVKLHLTPLTSAHRRSDSAGVSTPATSWWTTWPGERRRSGSENGSTTREGQVFGLASGHRASVSAERRVVLNALTSVVRAYNAILERLLAACSVLAQTQL